MKRPTHKTHGIEFQIYTSTCVEKAFDTAIAREGSWSKSQFQLI